MTSSPVASSSSELKLRKASFDEAVERGRATSAEWGPPLATAQFLERERRLLSVPWASQVVSTWFLEDPSGRCLSSCESFRTESTYKGTAGISCGIASVFTEASLRGRGYAADLLARVEARTLAEVPALQTFYLFSDVDPRYYEKLGYRALPAFDRVYEPEAGDPFEHVEAGEVESGTVASPYAVIPSKGYIDWQLERERAYASLLSRERPVKGQQGARSGAASLLWSASFKYDELFALLIHSQNVEDSRLLIQSARRMTARLGLKRFRAWEDRENFPWPEGGTREKRDGSIPMIRGIVAGLERDDWKWIPRAVWL